MFKWDSIYGFDGKEHVKAHINNLVNLIYVTISLTKIALAIIYKIISANK